MSMLTDLRQAVRSLLAAPGLTTMCVLTLALGIGATTATYSVVDAVLLRPLPYAAPERLAYVWEHGRGYADEGAQSSLRDFADWRRDTRTFDRLAAYRYWIFNLAGGPQAEGLLGAYVTDDALRTLGVGAALGRTFVAGEDRPGASHVVVIGDALWRRRFAADPGIIGRAIRMDGAAYTIVGVMPRGFDLPNTIPQNALLPSRTLDLWVPAGVDPLTETRGDHNWWVFGRLAPTVALERAQSELARFGAVQHAAHPASDEIVSAEGLLAHVVQPVRPALLLFASAVGLVLLVACANVAGLLLARGTARGRELGVRVALGASGWRLVRQLLVESALLAGAGAAAGLAVASLGVRALVALAPPGLPRVQEAGVHGAALACAALAALVSALAAGLLPALHAARTAPAGAMRMAGRGTTAAGGVQRARSALVVGEVALSLVLLAGAGLLVRSYVSLANVSVGFRSERLLTMVTLLPGEKYAGTRAHDAFYRRAADRMRDVPGVEDVAVVNTLPLSGMGSSSSAWVEGHRDPKPDELVTVLTRDVSPNYHALLGIRLIAGRQLGPADSAGAPPVVVVSRELVRRLFPGGENPLGRRLTHLRDAPPRIVGVVDDIRDDALDLPPRPTVYTPMAQDADVLGGFLVRTRGEPMAIEGAVRRALADVDPEQPVMNVRAMDDYLDQALETRRFSLFLTGVFAAVALALAMVGLYGVLAFIVGQRTREIGVRVALGAQRSSVAGLVLGGAVRLAGTGVLLGVPAALVGARLLRAQLYGVGPSDPLTFVAVGVAMVLTAGVAALVPARRAARVDPVVAMRAE